jgi:tetratricopeptide (TPR) repeat protein
MATPSASELLDLLAVLGRELVPWSVLSDPPREDPAAIARARELVEAELTQLVAGGQVVIADVGVSLSGGARGQLAKQMTKLRHRRSIETAAARLRAAFPANCDDVKTWPTCQQLVGHVRSLLDQALEGDVVSADLVWLRERLAEYTLSRGEPAIARRLLETALPLADVCSQRVDPLQIAVRVTLAESLNELGEQVVAKATADEALELLECHADPTLRASALFERGVALEAMGELDEARDAVEVAAATFAQTSPGSAGHTTALGRLAWLEYLAQEAPAARARLEYAMAIAADRQGAAHPETAKLRSTLGVVLRALGELPAARAELTRAVDDLAAALGGDHPGVAVARSNLSDVLAADRQTLEDAKLQLTLSLSSVDGVLPPSHQVFHLRHSKLAGVYEQLGDHGAVVEQRERALQVTRLAGASSVAQLARDLYVLAGARMAHGDVASARSDYEHALELGAHAPGDARGQLPLAFYARALAGALRSLGDLPEALARHMQALEYSGAERSDRWAVFDRLNVADLLLQLQPLLGRGLQVLTGTEADDTWRGVAIAAFEEAVAGAIALEDTALALIAGRFSTSAGDRQLAIRALEHASRLLDTPDRTERAPELLEALASQWRELARLLADEDAWADAELPFERQIAALESAQPVNAVRIGDAVHELGVCHEQQSKPDQAAAMFARAVALKREAGDKSLSLVRSLHALGLTLANADPPSAAEECYQECLKLLDTQPEQSPQWVGVILHDIGDIRYRDGRVEQAAELYERAAAEKRRADYPLDLAVTLQQLAVSLMSCDRADAAGAAALEAVTLLEPPGSPQPVELVRMLAVAASTSRGRVDLAIGCLARARAARPDPTDDIWTTSLRADIYEQHGYTEEAKPLRDSVSRTAYSALGSFEGTTSSEPRIAEILTLAGKFDDARSALLQASAVNEMAQSADAGNLVEGWRLLGARLLREGHFEDAERALEQSLELLSQASDTGSPLKSSVLYFLADARRASGKLQESARTYLESSADARAGALERQEAVAMVGYGRALLGCGEKHAALEAFSRALTVARAFDERDLHFEGVALHDLAVARSRQEGDGDPLGDGGRLERDAGALELFREAAWSKRRSGECTHSLAATMIAVCRASVISAEWESAAEAARDAARLFRQALYTPTGLLGPRDRLVQIATTRWPSDDDAARSALSMLRALTARGVGLIERLASGAGHASGAAEEGAVAELREMHVLEQTGRSLSEPGRRAATLLRARGAPPSAIPALLGADVPWWSHAIECGTLLARLAIGREHPGEMSLLDGISLSRNLSAASLNRVDAVAALAVSAVCGAEGSDAHIAAALAGVSKLAGGDARLLPALAIACVDLGEVQQAQELLERAEDACGPDEPEPSLRPDLGQLALAWHWLAVEHEARGDPPSAISTYGRSAATFARCHVEAERRVLGILADLALDDTALLDRVVGHVRGLRWRPTYDVRASRLARQIQLSRLQALLGERIAARGTLAFAGYDLRLSQHDHADLPAAEEHDRSALPSILQALSPLAIAVLERLRIDQAIAREQGTAPGLAASASSAWVVMRGAVELQTVGLAESDPTPGWFVLTPLGRDASALLLDA